MSKFKYLIDGIVKNNPTFVLVLGMCPTLATTTSAVNGMGMGLATMAVLLCSNMVISLLAPVIPNKVRIPAYITIIAAFVTIVQMIVKAYAPALNDALGVYLPLIVVNCIILGRAEMFASKNGVAASAIDGLGMGIGFTAALFLMGSIREILGAGSWLGLPIPILNSNPILIFILPPGGFFVFGMLMAIANKLNSEKPAKNKEEIGCAACPMHDNCGKLAKGEECAAD